jgi:alkyl sulfatase BDS1-like metallo-beta-lactamase superfamily hydrolase
MLLDVASVRVDPEKAAAHSFRINIELTDRGERHLVTVRNGVMIHETGIRDEAAGATVRMTRMDLLMTLLAGVPVATLVGSGSLVIDGDATLYDALVGLIEPITPNFNVVIP